MMINIEVGDQVMVCKPHKSKWGWMIYRQTAQGQMEAVGMYTDPAKLLVKIGQLLFERVLGTELPAGADPRIIKKSDPRQSIAWENPEIMAAVFFAGDEDRTTWSTEEEKEVIKREKERVSVTEELAK